MTINDVELKDEAEEEEYSNSVEKITRDELLKVTSHAIRHLRPKATGGRFRDLELEKLRDAKMRLLLDASKVHASILKDEQMDQLETRLKALEERIK